MIVRVTDFGLEGPYLGQVDAILRRDAPGVPIVDLFADAPTFDPQATSYLLAAYAQAFAPGTIFLCVVDPGVGSDRQPCIVRAARRWYVGPDNGLFDGVLRREGESGQAWRIDWRPEVLSATFHGRDLFAPVAARLARGGCPPGTPLPAKSLRRGDWPDDLARVVYVDRFGNAVSGLRARGISRTARLKIDGRHVSFAATFSDVPPGQPFWYENSNGLLEIAVNRGRAAEALGVGVGATITVEP